ncbi:cyclic nucleotide-binding domain-containing protein [Nordella sp. HKS 07]|uniref:Crp/Fnr family transcriptional regulator n=1 Tax=Nordella sp. HKS 07 TaxID=2712222 RepID=UPI0013E13DF7|nr:cyclic nucleotide-binding domain-containing protein [Nordella sp. HKS 07]QIG48192.1 cyclic nucleotide-binding domain-containing protein [Nordella sp. HKS 07]
MIQGISAPTMNVRANAESLRQIPLFAECDPAHLQVMAFAGEQARFAAGQEIFRIGGQGASAFLILSGEVDVWVNAGDKRVPVALAGPGAFLGELAMIAGLDYSLNATARTEVTATRISRDMFMRVVGEFPDFGAHVMAALSRKLAGSVDDFDRVRHLFERAASFPRR